jgi:phosphonate transport system ATP-binding protein
LKIQTRHLEARHRAYRSSDDRAIERLSLEIGAGEHVAIIGPSGSGKTTLLEVLACAMKPLSGSLSLDGQDPWQLSKPELQRLRGRLFLAPQVPPLPPRQRVVTAVLAGRLPSIGFFASLRSLIVPSDLPGALAALERFDLAEKLFERVDQLSGGERQRVGLARALMSPASLWLIDEPLSSLDPARLQQAMRALVDSANERGATLVTTLHQVDAALAFFPRIIGLRKGKLAFDLPSSQVTQEALESLYETSSNELCGADAADEHLGGPGVSVTALHCR